MTIARLALLYSAAGALLTGVIATFAPATFYEDFPFLSTWVDNLPPYNAHLTTDTGGLYLGFALLLGWAVVRRELIVPVCTAFALSQTIHLVFHLFHLDGYSTADAIGQTLALGGLIVAPLIAISAARGSSPSP